MAQRSAPVLLQANLHNTALLSQTSAVCDQFQSVKKSQSRRLEGSPRHPAPERRLPHSLRLGSLLSHGAPQAVCWHGVERRAEDRRHASPFRLPGQRPTPQFTEGFHYFQHSLSLFKKDVLPATAATMLRTTPVRAYPTLNLQAGDLPVGLRKAELLVQVFLKIDATSDPKKLKGYYGNTQLYCFVTL